MPKEVLIIDDEVELCDLLKACFEQKGCHVATAATAQTAMEQLRIVTPEIVLLDLRLPDRPGLELLDQLKREFPALRVIVISGLDDRRTIQDAMDRGASNYPTKPFDFTRCFYAAMDIETVDLTTTTIDPDVLARVPIAVAQQYHVVPVRMRQGTLELAVANPLDVQLLDELPMLLGSPIKALAVEGGTIADAIRRCYGVGAGVSPRGVVSTPVAREAPEPVREESAGVVQLINELIQHACANRASDLHVGLDARGPWIQERIDGVLYDVPVAPHLRSLYTSIISRFKVMANLNIAEHRVPQDGRIRFDQGAAHLDLRVSVLPTLHGENLVIRLLEPSRILHLAQLGLTETQLTQVDALLEKPTGLLLVTGPTGSGKSTSLYAFLSKLNTGKTSIVSIEDPVEHELPRATQIQVHPRVGLTFATGLRSMLRHDPDIVMVGEIRDQETAQLAIRAALTGHLVLSTLHTNDAASGITRLIDLGIEPFLLCSTLCGILSQRLIRLLCESCRQAVQVHEEAGAEEEDPGPVLPHGLDAPVHVYAHPLLVEGVGPHLQPAHPGCRELRMAYVAAVGDVQGHHGIPRLGQGGVDR